MSGGGSKGTFVPSASKTADKVTGAAMPQPFASLTGAAAATTSVLLTNTRGHAGSGVGGIGVLIGTSGLTGGGVTGGSTNGFDTARSAGRGGGSGVEGSTRSGRGVARSTGRRGGSGMVRRANAAPFCRAKQKKMKT